MHLDTFAQMITDLAPYIRESNDIKVSWPGTVTIEFEQLDYNCDVVQSFTFRYHHGIITILGPSGAELFKEDVGVSWFKTYSDSPAAEAAEEKKQNVLARAFGAVDEYCEN